MLERHADAIIGGALVLMALALIRPSSGMRMIALGLLLAAAAVVGMAPPAITEKVAPLPTFTLPAMEPVAPMSSSPPVTLVLPV